MAKAFFDRVQALCPPPPDLPPTSSPTSPSTHQLMLIYLCAALRALKDHVIGRGLLSERAEKAVDPTPSILPVLCGTGSLLFFWMRPWVALLSLSIALCFRSALALAIALILLWQMARTDWQLRRSLWDAGPVPPGLHFADTPLNRRRAAFFRTSPSMRRERELTAWLWNGDLQTLFPFLAFSAAKVKYRRFWFESTDPDGSSELLALDIAVPPSGDFDASKPLAIVCHGLNGGSGESYVMDFVRHATSQHGWTVAVMVARGLGGTPIRSSRLFHGARTSDLASAARLLSQAGCGAPLVGVGFSMGGIVLANYCGVEGEASPLTCAVVLSGCYDCCVNRHFAYSGQYWQPWLAQQLKTNFVLRQPAASYLASSGRVDVPLVLSAAVRSVTEFDAVTVVPYNGFASIDDYYERMSLAHGDKLRRVAVPLLALHAVDDPIVESSTFESSLKRATTAGSPELNPNLWFHITRRGGHIGWSLGWRPRRERWLFMHEHCIDFAGAVLFAQE